MKDSHDFIPPAPPEPPPDRIIKEPLPGIVVILLIMAAIPMIVLILKVIRDIS